MTTEPQNQLAEIVGKAEIFERNNDWQAAAEQYRATLPLAPLEAELWYRAGACLHRQGLPEEALQFLEKATMLAPESAVYELEKGDTLQALRRLREAVIAYARVLELEPDSVAGFTNMGIALHEGGHLVESIANLKCAMDLAPDDPIVRMNYGSAKMKIGDLTEALEHFRAATDLAPDYAEAWSNLGVALQDTHEIDAALDAHRRAIALSPEVPAIHWNYAMTLLLTGDYAAGFSEFECRQQMPDREPRQFVGKIWHGEDLANKTIFVHAEQGLGDTLQFARFLTPLATLGGRVVVSPHSAIADLVAGITGVSQVIGGSEAPPPFDFHIPLMSLPHRLGTSLQNLPSAPYLKPVSGVASLLPPCGDNFRIGLVWAGNPNHANDHNRSCPLTSLSPIFEVSGIDWISLQVGDANNAIRETGAPVLDLAEKLTDFSITAATMRDLDLVITVDTAVAHLAGALNHPVWILLPHAPDWRWLRDRRDCPWYPSAQLFRQDRAGDWAGVVAELIHEVRKKAAR